MIALLEGDGHPVLAHFARPWTPKVAQAFLRSLATYRRGWASLVRIAAHAVPVELLPSAVAAPSVPDGDYHAQDYLRALDEFQAIASARRAIAEEIAT